MANTTPDDSDAETSPDSNPSDAGSSDAAPSDSTTKLSKLPAFLVGIATLLMVFATFSVWVQVQALDTDSWVALSDELLDEPEVQAALADFLVDQLYESIDVTGEFESRLPDDFKGLAGPLSAALRGPATGGVESLIGSEQFRATWLAVNRTAHEILVGVLREEQGALVSTADGIVALELGDLVRRVGAEFGLSDDVLDRLPEDAGRVTIFESDDLGAAQDAVRVLDFLSWFLMAVVIVLYVAAVYLATGRRLRVLRNVGLSLVGAGVFVLIARALGVRVALDAIVETPGNQTFASVVADVATALIRQMAWSVIIYGLLIAGFAGLLGTHRRATSIRRFVAPVFNASAGAMTLVTAGLILLLLWWSPGRAFDRWITGLALGCMVIGAVIALRRVVLREFPSVTFHDTAMSVTDRFRR
jgi:hypothetical protein